MAPDFEIKSEDTFPYISGFVTDLDGLVDLSTASTVTLYLRTTTANPAVLVTGVCDVMSISDAIAAGLVGSTNTSVTPPAAWTVGERATVAAWKYEWASPDTNEPDDYLGEIEVTWAAGKIQTFPNERAANFTVKFGDDLD